MAAQTSFTILHFLNRLLAFKETSVRHTFFQNLSSGTHKFLRWDIFLVSGLVVYTSCHHHLSTYTGVILFSLTGLCSVASSVVTGIDVTSEQQWLKVPRPPQDEYFSARCCASCEGGSRNAHQINDRWVSLGRWNDRKRWNCFKTVLNWNIPLNAHTIQVY